VLAWARTAEEREAWAGLVELDPDPAVFERWHADPDVHPFELLADGELVGYGEVWEDRGEDEAELARIIVDPEQRGRGLGQTLVVLLVRRAHALGYETVWVRAVPGNTAAIACYAAAGFARASDEEAAAFNQGQPRSYVWMRLPIATAVPAPAP
jgi:RimJ/RimL family protein N-acetyltransferase